MLGYRVFCVIVSLFIAVCCYDIPFDEVKFDLYEIEPTFENK